MALGASLPLKRSKKMSKSFKFYLKPTLIFLLLLGGRQSGVSRRHGALLAPLRLCVNFTK
jgi:hypothetical protein